MFKRFLHFEEGHMGITEIWQFLDLKITAVAGGVVEGNAEGGERRSSKYFLGNAVPQNDVRTRGNGDTLAFSQIGLQRKMPDFVYRNLYWLIG